MSETDRLGIPVEIGKQARHRLNSAWEDVTYTLFTKFDRVASDLELTDEQVLGLVRSTYDDAIAEEYAEWLKDE